MRLREVFRYEIEYRIRSVSTWMYAGFLFLLAAWMFLATSDESGAAAHANAPERLAGGSALVGTVGLLVTAVLFGSAAVRDVEVGMDPLLFTSPLRKAEYLGGRFLAALTVNAVLIVAIPLGFLAATRFIGSFEPESVGPLRIGAYVQPVLLFMLPNLVLAGAILYTIGMFARKVVPVYLGAIGLFISYLVAMNALGQIENPVLAVLTDPIGMRTLQETTRYWTAAERNSRLIGFPADLLWNRAVWLTVAVAVLALLHWRFRFAHAGISDRRSKTRQPVGAARPERSRPVEVPRVAGKFGFLMTVRQTLAIAGRSLAEVMASRWFVVVILGCTGLTMLWGWNVGDTVFDTSTWPVTLLVAGTVLSERITPLIYALIAVYAGELVWKDRDANVDEITDAAPVPESVALLGRFLALVAMIAMFQAAFMVGGILIQALQGYYRFEIGLYLQILFGLNLVNYVLFAVLAMTIQVLVNHKYLGHIVVLMVFVSRVTLPMLGLVEHRLFLYGTDPGWTYSDMNGFGPFIEAVVWFKLYWAAWALLLAVLAILFWVRGRELSLRRRLSLARDRLTGSVARAGAAAIALILMLGGFIFYNTNILNEYRTAAEQGAPQAEYETRYSRYEDVRQPTIVDAELRVEIYPDQPAVDLRGSYNLVNRTDAAIDAVHVYLNPEIEARSLSFSRAAKPVLVDEALGYRIYALEQVLAPGDSLSLAFDVAFRPQGFRNSENQTGVVGNGAHFDRRWLPFIGYQPAVELPNGDARQRLGLQPQPPLPSADDPEARRYRWSVRNEDLVQVDAVIGTATDQIAVTPGVLRRSWTERGRRYFHYVTETPTSFGATIFSGKYAVLDDQWNDVALQIFYHPTHTYNLDRMVRSMKASLEYFTDQFGPYPDKQLRIVEFPRYGNFGVAHPHTTAFAEDAFLSHVKGGEVDQPFFGTAHETAHQWWGGRIRGAQVQGAAFLSESLANYSAMMVVEKTYGREAARRVYDFQMQRYLLGRASQSREVPVLEVEDQPYIAYRKGAIALYTLREHIGEEAVNTALRRYFEKYRDARPPYPTALDLYAELRAVTPDSLQYLLRDLFEDVILWDVEAERGVVGPTGAGEFQVTLDVRARKVRADSTGNETEAPLDDLVEIGVFAPGEGDSLGEPLYLKQHRIRSGQQTITVTVPREPAHAGIDPYHKLIDRQGDDNVVGLGADRAGSSGP
ncbi:MAG TPA: M1 family aminopeptidase [Herpetosiphonaceae bacterium]